jgi:hypothetical protein
MTRFDGTRIPRQDGRTALGALARDARVEAQERGLRGLVVGARGPERGLRVLDLGEHARLRLEERRLRRVSIAACRIACRPRGVTACASACVGEDRELEVALRHQPLIRERARARKVDRLRIEIGLRRRHALLRGEESIARHPHARIGGGHRIFLCGANRAEALLEGTHAQRIRLDTLGRDRALGLETFEEAWVVVGKLHEQLARLDGITFLHVPGDDATLDRGLDGLLALERAVARGALLPGREEADEERDDERDEEHACDSAGEHRRRNEPQEGQLRGVAIGAEGVGRSVRVSAHRRFLSGVPHRHGGCPVRPEARAREASVSWPFISRSRSITRSSLEVS